MSYTHRTGVVKYTAEVFDSVGRGLAVTLLDLAGTNPYPRLGASVPPARSRKRGSAVEGADSDGGPTLALLQR